MRKRRTVFGSLIIAVMAIGIALTLSLATSSVRRACGCGSVDDEVTYFVNTLDTQIQQYAAQHDGLYPSYAEVGDMFKVIEPVDVFREWMTPDIDINSGVFKSSSIEGPKIGYKVSDDRRKYVMLGLGVDIKETHLFGHVIWSTLTFPVFHPGDTVPSD